jgi:hypothetical protein
MRSISFGDCKTRNNRLHKFGFAILASFAALSAAAVGPTNSITVSPLATGLVGAASDPVVVLNWAGGTAPYQVQYATSPATTNWQDSDVVTSNTTQTSIMSSPSGFYRVASMAGTLAGAKDKTAPSVPTGLSASAASSSQINLSWNASTDNGANASGVKGYNVYRNTIFLKQVLAPATSTSDTVLKPSTTYSYAVSAVDNTSNASAKSGSVSATTPASTACTFSLSPTNATSAAAAGTGSVSVTASSGSCAWNASSGTSWITITAGASGTGNGTLSYSVAANTSTTARTGTMTIAGKTFIVTQSGQSVGPANNDFANATVLTGSSPTTTGSNVGATRESGEPNFAGNGGGASVWWSWTAPSSGTATISLAGSSFDTILGVYIGTSVSALTLVAQNDDYTGLQSAVTFTATAGTTFNFGVDGYNGATGSINLSVSVAGTCSYSISPASASVAATASTGSFNVTAGTGCSWNASSTASWLAVTAGTSGSGSGTVSYSVAATTDTVTRTGTITIADQTFTVAQDAGTVPCSYSISPGSASFAATAGNGSINVTATTGCSWTASSGATWITITAGVFGSGNGTVSYSVAANTDTAARSATLTIAGYSFPANQAGAQITDTTPPNVSLTSPTDGSIVSGTITLSATASDNVSVARVEFYCDNTLIGTAAASPYNLSYDTTVLANAAHLFYAKAYDAAGNSTSSPASNASVNNGTSSSPGGTFQWAKAGLVSLDSATRSVATDQNGNLVTVGWFRNPIDFGGGPLACAGGRDGFVAKFDLQGSLLWAKRFGSISDDDACGVATDSGGNIIVIGNFIGTSDLTGTGSGQAGVTLLTSTVDPYSGQYSTDLFVAKYSSSGSVLWAKRFGGTAGDNARAVTVDANGNVFISAVCSSTSLTFDSVVLNNPNGNLLVLAKLSGIDGSVLWAKGYAAMSIDVPSIDIDRSGDLVIGGSFYGSVDLGGGTRSSAGSLDILVAKVSGVDGSWKWDRTCGGPNQDNAYGISADPTTGNVVVTGKYMGSVTFAGGVVTDYLNGAVNTTGGAFIAAFDPLGNYLWAKTPNTAMFGFSNETGYAVKADPTGNIYVTGVVNSPVYFGEQFLSASGASVFVASLTRSGSYRWTKRSTGGSGNGFSIALDSFGHVAAAGLVQNGQMYFDLTLGAAGGSVSTGSGTTAPWVAQFSK